MSNQPPNPPDLPPAVPDAPDPEEATQPQAATQPQDAAPPAPVETPTADPTPAEPVAAPDPVMPAPVVPEPIVPEPTEPDRFGTRPLPKPAPGAVPQATRPPVPVDGPGHCPRCGGTDFATGALLTYSGKFRPAYYKPGRLSRFRLNNLLRPFRALAEVEALACRTCGLIIFQVDPTRLARIHPPDKP